jgi:hypothetical protein
MAIRSVKSTEIHLRTCTQKAGLPEAEWSGVGLAHCAKSIKLRLFARGAL